MMIDIQNPPTDLTLESLAQLAASMERSAAATYCRLAADMKKLHNPEAVEMFERLIEIERGYQSEISTWAHDLDIEISTEEDKSTPAVEDRESQAATDLLLTPWQAINMAVRTEQEAFEFFTALAANANQEDVRQQSETVASRKLEHIALLRLERKRAWRTDERARLEAIVGQDIPGTLASFEKTTRELKSALRQRYLELAVEGTNLGNHNAATLLRQLAAEIPDNNPGTEVTMNSVNETTRNDKAAVLRAALRETEAAFDAFMAVAARATSEDIVDAAQVEASECVARLEGLRDELTAYIGSLATT